jgi:hypothetical protein
MSANILFPICHTNKKEQLHKGTIIESWLRLILGVSNDDNSEQMLLMQAKTKGLPNTQAANNSTCNHHTYTIGGSLNY